VLLNYEINNKMAKSDNANSQMELFIQGMNMTVPFNLDINGKSYICSEILRFLPGKRIVVKAAFSGKSYVIKLFSNAKKGKRELKRELEGYRLTLKANINLPQLEFVSDDVEEYSAIAYEFLELAQPFNNDESILTQYVEQLLDLVFALHSRGIYQSDFHLDNLLMLDKQLFLIDLASVKVEQENRPLSKQISLANLAMLIVQFIPKQQQILIDKLPDYFDKRGWVWNKVEQDTFEDYVHQAWLQRKKLYLKKCFRACTMTAYDKTFSQQTAFQRSFIDEVGPDFINNIDLLVEQGKLLKDGNSATVVKVTYAGKQLVIKRYNIKSFWHWLKRCYRPSRAAVSWRNGNLLELMGVATPKTLGFIENRFGYFRMRAYLVCEYTKGQELQYVYERREPTEYELEQLNTIFTLLQNYQISHGDLKASNLLLDQEGLISLIDLDAMREHHNSMKLLKAAKKDKKRFMQNWKRLAVRKVFEELLN